MLNAPSHFGKSKYTYLFICGLNLCLQVNLYIARIFCTFVLVQLHLCGKVLSLKHFFLPSLVNFWVTLRPRIREDDRPKGARPSERGSGLRSEALAGSRAPWEDQVEAIF